MACEEGAILRNFQVPCGAADQVLWGCHLYLWGGCSDFEGGFLKVQLGHAASPYVRFQTRLWAGNIKNCLEYRGG